MRPVKIPSATKLAINTPDENALLTNYLSFTARPGALQRAGCSKAAGPLERLNNYGLLKPQLNDLGTFNLVDEDRGAIYVTGCVELDYLGDSLVGDALNLREHLAAGHRPLHLGHGGHDEVRCVEGLSRVRTRCFVSDGRVCGRPRGSLVVRAR